MYGLFPHVLPAVTVQHARFSGSMTHYGARSVVKPHNVMLKA